MLRIILGILYFGCLLGGAISIVFVIYYHFAMDANVKPRSKPFLAFLGPFSLMLPLYNEEGNRARIKFVICVLLFGVFFGTCALILKLPLD